MISANNFNDVTWRNVIGIGNKYKKHEYLPYKKCLEGYTPSMFNELDQSALASAMNIYHSILLICIQVKVKKTRLVEETWRQQDISRQSGYDKWWKHGHSGSESLYTTTSNTHSIISYKLYYVNIYQRVRLLSLIMYLSGLICQLAYWSVNQIGNSLSAQPSVYEVSSLGS